MKIREMKKSEIREVAEIFKIGSNSAPYNEKWTSGNALRKIKEYIKDKHKIYVALVDNKIAGFITAKLEYTYYGNKIFIQEFFIKKEFQGKGIGTALLSKIEQDYKGKTKKLFLVAGRKAPAFKFYKKRGFNIDKTAAYMVKRLK